MILVVGPPTGHLQGPGRRPSGAQGRGSFMAQGRGPCRAQGSGSPGLGGGRHQGPGLHQGPGHDARAKRTFESTIYIYIYIYIYIPETACLYGFRILFLC